MKSKITKLATAAVITLVILVSLPFFSRNGSGVVLADVLERIEQVMAFMYRGKMTITGSMMPNRPAGKKEMDSTVTISNEYGMKMEMTTTDVNTGREEMTQQMYILPDQKVMIMVMPEQKKYMRMEFDDDLLARMKKQNNDPREMIKQIMNCEYTELGRSVIDGIEVDGFETTDPAVYGGAMGTEGDSKLMLWVDVESRLPVRMKMDFKMNEQMQMSGVVYDYQWNVQVDASEFEPVIPEDFTAFPTGGMKMPGMTEEAAIEGLKFFAEMTGQYPKKLNLMNLMQEFSTEKNPTDAALKIKEEMKQIPEEEKMKKIMEMMRPVQSLGMFYMTLVQDKKEPAYYGESVSPEDVDAVLMRWKISDGQYRVIFGDLTAENVTAEELADESDAVFYFPGCGSERLFSQVGLATMAMLYEVGAQTVLPPGYLCCGYPQRSMGDESRGRAITTANRVLFHRIANTLNYMDIKTVIVSCGTCMDQLLLYEFQKIFPGSRLLDIHEYLLEKGVSIDAVEGVQYLYHDPCHSPMKTHDPVHVASSLLGQSVTLSDRCCGEAGTFAVARPDIAPQVRFRKQEELIDGISRLTGKDRVENSEVKLLTSCPACQQGLSRYRDDTGLQTDYIVVELANQLLGEGWQASFISKAKQGGIERILL